MAVAALITWLITALGGFYLLATWLARGGARQQAARTTRFPAPVIYGHFGLAAAGLVVWVIFVINSSKALAWTAFVILLPVALLGFTMLARWIPSYRARAQVPAAAASGAGGVATAAAASGSPDVAPPEQSFPIPVVLAHGLFATVTLVLVLLAAAGLG